MDLDFVNKIREKGETMGFDRKDYYMRVRPALVEGKVYLRAETKKKVGGWFEGLACWRVLPRDKECCKCISRISELEWLIVK